VVVQKDFAAFGGERFFWIAILTDFAKQNQSKWRSKRNIIWRLQPTNESSFLQNPRFKKYSLPQTAEYFFSLISVR